MTSTLTTASANRLHIGFFGRRNSGKSSLINAFTGQEVSIVSDVPGTTTDPVAKPMEIRGIGACTLTDTAGFDDVDILGSQRVEKTEKAAEKVDIAVMVLTDGDTSLEQEWLKLFKNKNTPVLGVLNKSDIIENADEKATELEKKLGIKVIAVSAKNGYGTDKIRDGLLHLVPEDFGVQSITRNLCSENDVVLLVMPQDIQAPKGRLIMPQVQTIRELLDKKCTVICTTADKFDNALNALKEPPSLIITDSQVFGTVYQKKPEKSRLTSFSVLFAALKGDIDYYMEGAAAIDSLTENSRVLIAECCTHAPTTEDIGRVKIPALLRKRIGQGLTVEFSSGTDYPADLSGYDLIIQCGACMFNRKYVMSRIQRAMDAKVPMTNYGVTIAYLTGILDKITI
ncbi:MAG: [FeFe] hydrogenase H-cluster maturation GTPase HydF [Ruminococcaceae bacterium]|nr:[FeFe] hydrogenase H-cluster maturation GTPase HydF [Oscillospiraceae bacterium]